MMIDDISTRTAITHQNRNRFSMIKKVLDPLCAEFIQKPQIFVTFWFKEIQ